MTPDSPVRRWPIWLNFNYLVLRAFCVLGHDDEQLYGPDRVYLRCQNCRRETPGWIVPDRRIVS